MATITAEAKLYTGIRCWVVDKNTSAALTSSFSLGNRNFPNATSVGGVPTIFADVKVNKLIKFVADLEVIGSVSLVNERLKTFGAGNNVITAGSPRVINNTRNWRVNSVVVCKFPTYFRIDVEKLQLPEGTDCIVQLEEGWLLEGDYPGSFNSPSPRNDNFVQFRTPYYGLSFMNSAFSLPNRTALRIKQLASSVSSAASFTALPIFNPGKLAALFGGVFLTIPNAVKTVSAGATLFNSFGPLDVGGNPVLLTALRIKQLASIFDTVFALTSDAIQFKGPGFVSISSTATISALVDRNIGPITSLLADAATMNTVAVKTARITKEIIATASVSADVFVQKGLPVTNLGMTASLSVSADVPMVLTSTSSIVQLPLWYGSINAVIDWGDGTTQTVTSTPGTKTSLQKNYGSTGTRTIYIKGFVQHWGYQNASQFSSATNQIAAGLGYQIETFGDIGIQTLIALKAAFVGIEGPTPRYIPSTVKDISYFFFRNGDLGGINNISRLGNWNTSNIEKMEGLFRLAGDITAAPITGWNTGSVTSMKSMFNNCTFNSNINGWNVSNVQDFSEMFRNAKLFNQNLSSWNVSSGTDFRFMFSQTNVYNAGGTNVGPGYSGQLYNWNLSSATSPAALEHMLQTGYQYPVDITSWCVPNITSRPFNFAASGSGFFSGGEPVWGTCPGPRPIITVTTNKTTVNEGETITITITSSNVSTATIYFRINADFPSWLNPGSSEGSPDSQTGRIYPQDVNPQGGSGGTVTLSSGTATMILTIPQDNIIEITNESFRVDITSISFAPSTVYSQFVLGASPTLTINSNNT